MKKILVVLTNIANYPKKDELIGLWLSEATEFVSVIQKAGYIIDYASPKGGYVPVDPRSLMQGYFSKEDLEVYTNKDFKNRALANSLPLRVINPSSYQAIYFAGGHGAVFDFAEQPEIKKIIAQMYQNGSFITAVCHGVAALLNVQSPSNSNEFLIKDKKITGFTKIEELFSGKFFKVPYQLQTQLKKQGAKFKKKRAFKKHVIQDGQFITGQNPFSGKLVAETLLQNLEKRNHAEIN
ncbi:type 1 glutamine amidotransferase domain-containing protein [Mycoplasmopsis gallopavonis]|uniref:Molecular chaperone Hsp31 and glyoxalase 3 n=1 Tax=Mycoplasmopsis gallopavonis TaxID=76629 RepID=A0A449AYJ3_9BACT|nr:type 1 glutamine amidotransferase domain-containing protein [Mycoplasmopsis gallopavonis]RIV16748.1 type 1 glutamine amidotransferase domain-containing protein [Mycoplasmopsis gallopavonis]VEU72564.1 Molecular chaperone Hsp31 and glyoxalase 3 [Mycoplasmopsis gallopavonis]